MPLFFHLWPLIKEIFASIKDNPELQHRSAVGAIAKLVIILLIVALLSLGDIALDSYNEVQKLKEERFEQRLIAKKEEKSESISEDRVKVLLCESNALNRQSEIDDLKDRLAEYKVRVSELEHKLESERSKRNNRNLPKPTNDRRIQDRLNQIEDGEDSQ